MYSIIEQETFFENVEAEPSNSSYGRWVVKYSPIHFKFFWKKAAAIAFANNHNLGMAEK